MANDFIPFATSGTANVYTNAEYVADTDTANGNQPGIAKSKLVNKALRQCSIISTVVAQYIADITGTNAVDDGTTATLLTNFKTATNVATNTHASTSKTTPVDADELALVDSAASNALKKLTWANLKANVRDGLNLITNSNGLVNQRGYVSGTATTAANQYTIDMFRVVTSGQNLTFATTAGVTTFTAPAGGVDLPIENLNILGGSYVLSFTGTATAVVAQSADNVTYANVTPVGGVYTITGGYYVLVRFSGGTFSKPKFEEGTVSTPYSLPEFGGELQACQRYLPTILSNSTYIGQCANSTTAYIAFPYLVSPRIAPTGALLIGTLGNSTITNAGAGTGPILSLVFVSAGLTSALLSCTVTSGIIAGDATMFNVGSNKIFLTGCEL